MYVLCSSKDLERWASGSGSRATFEQCTHSDKTHFSHTQNLLRLVVQKEFQDRANEKSSISMAHEIPVLRVNVKVIVFPWRLALLENLGDG